jgi:DNA-binding NtrC family response regulator
VLAQVFVQQAAQKHRRKVEGISGPAMALLRGYDFPGNVRELKNLLEHAVILSTGPTIQKDDLPGSVQAAAPAPAPAAPKGERRTLRALRETWLAPLERDYLHDLLRACDGNVREASRRAGVTAATLYRLMARRRVKVTRATVGAEAS